MTEGSKYCQKCGAQIDIEAEICPKCGVRQTSSTPTPEKNKLTAALLALILGGFGAHKFYLGQSGLGVAYLLFFWTFIPAIIALIEGLVLLSMSEEDFQKKYGGK